MNDFVAVIMAGGSGQRFWPLSTAARPKQFLDFEQSGRSLLQATFDRLLPVAGRPERILIVTGEAYAALVGEQLPELPRCNLVLEPVGRDTAAAVALASLEARARYGDPVLGFFPSDHRVGDVAAFQQTVQRAIDLAAVTSGLVTLGMQPDRPATGYGYIERGEPTAGAYRVARFVEKPDRARAQQYLDSGRYFWNGGIFLWQVATILEELALHAPELLPPLAAAYAAGRTAEIFPALPRISIDYAVMEKTDRAYVLPADFDWDDVGDWQALERLLKRADGDANTVVGQHVGYETSGNIIYIEEGDGIVATLGVENLVIVKRGNAVLLVRKDRVQDLKKLLSNERLLELTFPPGLPSRPAVSALDATS